MKCKTKILKYFLAGGMVLVISGSVYLYFYPGIYDEHTATSKQEGADTPLRESSDKTKNNRDKRSPTTLIPNPDGCYITLDNGKCAKPGSF